LLGVGVKLSGRTLVSIFKALGSTPALQKKERQACFTELNKIIYAKQFWCWCSAHKKLVLNSDREDQH
jgi:hypothetical protein